MAAAIGWFAVCAVGLADISLPKIFSDHMVLQDADTILIWGKSDGQEELNVKLGESSAKVVADAEGAWTAKLARPKGNGPFELEVAGKTSKVVLTDVMIGQVWLCSGQSNMEWSLKQSENPDEEIKGSTNGKIRLFKIQRHAIDHPLSDFEKKVSWELCDPKSSTGFSAVAYYFGKKLQKELKCPVGLIQSAWGGTPAESWADRKDMEAVGALKPLLEHWDGRTKDIQSPHRPANLYNGMIAPLAPYRFRGAIWYQGESNVGRGSQYATLFPTMIQSWRKKFQNDDFPFYFVNLAPYRYSRSQPDALPEVWDAQNRTLSLKNTGMVVISDIGNTADIHPRNKKGVGERLALWALARDYGKKDIVYSGPFFEKMEIENDKIRIRFKHVGSGLVSKDGKELNEFLIAGADKKFVPAKAVIDGETVVVSAEGIERPVAVRFCWKDTATPNLFNKEGLPAAPFRTDDFELKSADKHFK